MFVSLSDAFSYLADPGKAMAGCSTYTFLIKLVCIIFLQLFSKNLEYNSMFFAFGKKMV